MSFRWSFLGVLITCAALIGCSGGPAPETTGPDTQPDNVGVTPDTPPGTPDAPPATADTPPVTADTPAAVTPPKPTGGDELLASVPTRATGVVLVNAQQLQDRPWMKQMAEQAPGANQDTLETMQNLKSVLLVMAPLRGEPEEFGPPAGFASMRVFASVQAAQEEIAKNPDLIEDGKYKDATIYQSSFGGARILRGAAIYEGDDLDFLKEMVDGGGPSPELKAMLDQVGLGKDLVFAADFRQMQKFLSSISDEMTRNPITATLGLAARNLQTARGAFNMEGDSLVNAEVQMANAESAQQVADLANVFIPMGKSVALQQITAGADPAAAETLAGVVESFFRGIKVTAEGAQLTGVVAKPEGFDQWPTEFAPLMKQAAEEAERQNRIKQVALALHNYHDTFGSFPPAVIKNDQGEPLYSWRVAILPFVEQGALYDQFHLDEPWDSTHNKPLSDQVVDTYGDTNTTSILAMVGPGTAFEEKKGKSGWRISDFTDGTSNTIFFVVAGPDKAVPWAKPADLPYKVEDDLLTLFGELEGGRLFTGFVDASVHRFDLESESEKIQAALIRNDGKVPR